LATDVPLAEFLSRSENAIAGSREKTVNAKNHNETKGQP
jgi:hypothetical protein